MPPPDDAPPAAAPAGAPAFSRCPKCGHTPLPADQRLPVACPRCGVVLAKAAQARADAAAGRDPLAQRRAAHRRAAADVDDDGEPAGWAARLLAVPERVDGPALAGRAALLAVLCWVGLRLIALDHRHAEINNAFLHGPLLVFHEAGHVLFAWGGRWLTVAGGTLMQLLVPAVVAGAFLWRQRDPFGAAVGLWALGVSLLDVAPYVYDAADPQIMLLTGATGEAGGHDWIYLLRSLGLLARAQALGTATHRLGALVLLAALVWAAWLLWRQWRVWRSDHTDAPAA